MEGILETDIEKKGIHEFLICQSHKLFKHHAANNHIYRSIWAGSFITIKDRKIIFVDQGEYFSANGFAQDFSINQLLVSYFSSFLSVFSHGGRRVSAGFHRLLLMLCW